MGSGATVGTGGRHARRLRSDAAAADGTSGRIAQGRPPAVARGGVGSGIGQGEAAALAEAGAHAGSAVELAGLGTECRNGDLEGA